MPIPPLNRESVEQALELLSSELDQIQRGPHKSRIYDLLWKGMRFPPKVVISKAAEVQYGDALPETEFSGGEDEGHANGVLKKLGFKIVTKSDRVPLLPLDLHERFTRREIYAADGVAYDQQQRHLNTGLSPQCRDGGYFIFVTLNKDELDPAHDYDDELYADHLKWASRRGVLEEDVDYVRLRHADTRVSLFVRNNPNEKFVYAGELSYLNHSSVIDTKSGKPQLRFLWSLKEILADRLLEELTFGVTSAAPSSRVKTKQSESRRSRLPSSFDEFRKAFSYAVGAVSDRIVVPEHYNYQVRLAKFLRERGVTVEMERDFVDVAFAIGGRTFIGEIKVTRNLTLPQAFRTALGQVIEYAHLLFPRLPHMIIFDQVLDAQRVAIATAYGITVVAFAEGEFRVLNPSVSPAELLAVLSGNTAVG